MILRDLGFTRLDWLVAWRHLRTGDGLPAWVNPLIMGSLYLVLVGVLLAGYAASLDAPTVTVLSPFDLEAEDSEMGPTPLQRYYGALGGVTMFIGVMALLFGLLARFFNLLPTIITMSVLLGCMALVVVLSLMSGLESDLRDKILDQKAHIRVAREDGRPFEDYPGLVDAIAVEPGIAGVSPYLEGEIMVRSGLNRQGAILAGIVSELHARASNLPELVREGSWSWLDHPDRIPDPDPFAADDPTPWRLRHLQDERKKGQTQTDEAPETRRGIPGVGVQTDADADEGGEDEAWEDPSVEIPKLRGELPRSKLPPAPELGDLPPPPPPDAVDADGWEDPSVLVPQLREQGLAPARKPGAAEPTQPADAADSAVAEDEAVLDPILLGRELAMELGVRLGSEVQLITPIGRMTPAGRIPGVLASKVAGVFYSGMYEYDRKNVYAPLRVVQRFLLVGDKVSGIEVKLVDADAIDQGKAVVERVVAASGRGGELVVEDWRDLNRNLFSAMFLEKVAMFIALLFVVLVASFGILASNLMSVMEKSKEIAILKAMGAGDRGILRVFIAEGLCVGILGAAGGIAMGLGLCWALDRYGLPIPESVYYIEKLPVVVNPEEVVLVGVAALVIVCISSLYPALVASRLRPVDALRQADQ
jgi:lipoprotein-releasing system permease protein